MIVLEEWRDRGFPHRLVVTKDGHLAMQFSDTGDEWFRCRFPSCLPLFAPNETPRPTARAKSRPRTRRT